jgi:hypothetical protein
MSLLVLASRPQATTALLDPAVELSPIVRLVEQDDHIHGVNYLVVGRNSEATSMFDRRQAALPGMVQ